MNAASPVDAAAPFATAPAADIAAAVRGGQVSARAVVEAVLARIAALDPKVNAFTDVTGARARASADALDARRAAGGALGPLAGVPFAVKNLFDIAGLPTRAGSKINRDLPPAAHDAALIARLEEADAILVGGLNMGEYAYDFTGENVHDGASRNPHDLAHMAGGSSGGSGAAIAAGLVPLALGSDTNGSIRVPSSLCGIFGLKPTYGRLSRAHSFPFVSALDHLGPFARSVGDLALAYDAMQGADPDDPVQVPRPVEPVMPTLEAGMDGLRIAVAGGYFRAKGMPEAFAAVDHVAAALGVTRTIEVPEAARARASAYIITAAEGASLHAGRLRTRPQDFDPAVRDRLIAGLAIPAAWVAGAQRFRRHFRDRMLALFDEVDVILAPATPCRAPQLGQTTFELDGETLLVRPNLGLYTQPISFIGLPVAAVPVWLDGGLPIGVQVIAPPWREDLALRVARHLEATGAVRAPVSNI
ncbi:AtzE family amidohydrolase [Azorhizobium doebereinerae]|uniref:AtzE family amidohydrolase n=1 Tax=Azorhizobium doebereinerae TaxID=281091 RepID=UPI0003FAFD7E|nr:AtzE family amidohydrolase [Azorhizobium doebereinerae]